MLHVTCNPDTNEITATMYGVPMDNLRHLRITKGTADSPMEMHLESEVDLGDNVYSQNHHYTSTKHMLPKAIDKLNSSKNPKLPHEE